MSERTAVILKGGWCRLYDLDARIRCIVGLATFLTIAMPKIGCNKYQSEANIIYHIKKCENVKSCILPDVVQVLLIETALCSDFVTPR